MRNGHISPFKSDRWRRSTESAKDGYENRRENGERERKVRAGSFRASHLRIRREQSRRINLTLARSGCLGQERISNKELRGSRGGGGEKPRSFLVPPSPSLGYLPFFSRPGAIKNRSRPRAAFDQVARQASQPFLVLCTLDRSLPYFLRSFFSPFHLIFRIFSATDFHRVASIKGSPYK